jgi:hypothetical protein
VISSVSQVSVTVAQVVVATHASLTQPVQITGGEISSFNGSVPFVFSKPSFCPSQSVSASNEFVPFVAS